MNWGIWMKLKWVITTHWVFQCNNVVHNAQFLTQTNRFTSILSGAKGIHSVILYLFFLSLKVVPLAFYDAALTKVYLDVDGDCNKRNSWENVFLSWYRKQKTQENEDSLLNITYVTRACSAPLLSLCVSVALESQERQKNKTCNNHDWPEHNELPGKKTIHALNEHALHILLFWWLFVSTFVVQQIFRTITECYLIYWVTERKMFNTEATCNKAKLQVNL